MNAKDKKLDDLTLIKGIGHSRQEWLRNQLGVHTYHDLAALTVDKILSQLKTGGQIASRSEVEKWIGQARELATYKGDAAGEYQPFASFVVEFQIRRGKTGSDELRTEVQHMEADEGEHWPGIEMERLSAWMRDRIGKEGPEMAKQKQSTSSSKPLSISVDQVSIFQPPDAERPCVTILPGQSADGFIRSNELFKLQESFSVTGLKVDNTACYVQFYALEQPLDKEIHLGDTEPLSLVESQVSYQAEVTGVSLPTGSYLLRVLTRVKSTPPNFVHFKVPMLQVI